MTCRYDGVPVYRVPGYDADAGECPECGIRARPDPLPRHGRVAPFTDAADLSTVTLLAGRLRPSPGRVGMDHQCAIARVTQEFGFDDEFGDHSVMAALLYGCLDESDVTPWLLRENGVPPRVVRAVMTCSPPLVRAPGFSAALSRLRGLDVDDGVGLGICVTAAAWLATVRRVAQSRREDAAWYRWRHVAVADCLRDATGRGTARSALVESTMRAAAETLP